MIEETVVCLVKVLCHWVVADDTCNLLGIDGRACYLLAFGLRARSAGKTEKVCDVISCIVVVDFTQFNFGVIEEAIIIASHGALLAEI
jgi:hypothetical protein